MVHIKFQINGKNVNANNLREALEAASLSTVSAKVEQSVSHLRYAEHGQSPKIKVKGRNLRNLSFEVSGCCPDLIEKACATLA